MQAILHREPSASPASLQTKCLSSIRTFQNSTTPRPIRQKFRRHKISYTMTKQKQKTSGAYTRTSKRQQRKQQPRMRASHARAAHPQHTSKWRIQIQHGLRTTHAKQHNRHLQCRTGTQRPQCKLNKMHAITHADFKNARDRPKKIPPCNSDQLPWPHLYIEFAITEKLHRVK